MPALTTFCNPDPQALRIAQELHRSEKLAYKVCGVSWDLFQDRVCI